MAFTISSLNSSNKSLLGVFGIDANAGKNFVDPLVQYKLEKKQGTAAKEKFAESTKVQAEVEYFKKKAATIKTTEEFFKDRRLVSYALSAFTMDDEINLLGRVKKVMLEDPKDEKALQSRLSDKRYKEIATAFEFFDKGVTKLTSPTFLKDLESRYVTNEYEKKQGEKNPALRSVAYFLRNGDKIDSSLGILGDKVFRDIALTTLDLPLEIANQTVKKQAKYIDDRIDVSKFKDPKFREQFAEKFLLKKSSEQSTERNNNLLGLFNNNGIGTTFNILA